MLIFISLLCAVVAGSRLADSKIEGNTMTTTMPLDRVVYVAMQGLGKVTVEARAGHLSGKLTCESEIANTYCLLWTPEHNAFKFDITGVDNKVNLKLRAFARSTSESIKYKVVSGAGLALPNIGSTFVQLNGIKDVSAHYPLQPASVQDLHVHLQSSSSHRANYANRLTVSHLGAGGKLSTDASGRIATLKLKKPEGPFVHLKVSAEAGSHAILSAEHPKASTASHLAVDTLADPVATQVKSSQLGGLNQAPYDLTYTKSETSTDPITDELVNDGSHWLEDGEPEFRILDEELRVGRVIGRGHFGEVHEVFDFKFGVQAAAKLLKKSRKMKSIGGIREINKEVNVLNKLPVHQNICRFFRAFETTAYVYLPYQDRDRDGELRCRQHVCTIRQKKSHRV